MLRFARAKTVPCRWVCLSVLEGSMTPATFTLRLPGVTSPPGVIYPLGKENSSEHHRPNEGTAERREARSRSHLRATDDEKCVDEGDGHRQLHQPGGAGTMTVRCGQSSGGEGRVQVVNTVGAQGWCAVPPHKQCTPHTHTRARARAQEKNARGRLKVSNAVQRVANASGASSGCTYHHPIRGGLAGNPARGSR